MVNINFSLQQIGRNSGIKVIYLLSCFEEQGVIKMPTCQNCHNKWSWKQTFKSRLH